jgi:chromosome segregation ATPase
MGNIYSDIKQYLGYEQPILNPDQLLTQTQEIRTQILENQIKNLHEKIDKNKDNIVTKDELKDYFDTLSLKIDKNSDGVITKDELEAYVNRQLSQSKDEIEQWKNAYNNLNEKYETLLDQLRSEETRTIEVSQVSSQALKDYIKSEIIDSDANLKYVPDALERKVYLTVYKTIMKSLEGLFNTTSIDFLNHRVSFAIQPISLDERISGRKD